MQTYEQALKQIGSPVVAAAEAVLKDEDVGQKISLLEVLSKIPFEESVSLLLNHYDDLLQEIPDMLLMALEDLGDHRAMPLIERDIGKEEFDFDHAFLLLCELHGLKHPMLPKLRADIERAERRSEAAMERAETEGLDALLADDPGPLHLKLKCRACSRVYSYDIEEVFVNPEEKKQKDSPADSAFFIRERIICKNCGAEDDYSFTNEAMLRLTVEIVRQEALTKQGCDPSEVRSRVKLIEFGLQDGTRCTPREALEIYKRRIAADPKDPELYLRLANVYTFLHRYEDAMAYYQQALALDPDHLLTFFHLANAYGMMGQEQKAMRTMEEFLNRAARKPRLTPLERECFEEAKEAFGLPDDFEDIMFIDRKGKPLHRLEATRTKGYLTAKPTPPSFTTAKPNQFCPCGSGKKYKKCCMSKT
jgi:tetratricopeptide (TPR) repeat protein